MKKTFISIILVLLFLMVNQPSMAEGFSEKTRIVIDIPRYSLTLYYGGREFKTYPVAVGKSSTGTPPGAFSIYNMAVNPTWHPNSKDAVPPGPENPLGIRWLGFYRGYGIHGNNNPDSIGKAISAGCIRMFNYDVRELYSMVGIGVPVQVIYDDLIETKEEQSVIAHCDIYRKEKDYRRLLAEKLKNQGIMDKIPKGKLEKLFIQLDKRTVVFSDKWVLTINGKYMTSDTIYDRTMLFVNSDVLNSFLGIDIGWDDTAKTGRLMGSAVSAYKIGRKIYVSIFDVAREIGGCLTAYGDIEQLDYNINFIKLDGKFIISDIKNFKTHPEVDANVLGIPEKGLIRIEELGKEGFEYNILSKKGFIEIFSDKDKDYNVNS